MGPKRDAFHFAETVPAMEAVRMAAVERLIVRGREAFAAWKAANGLTDEDLQGDADMAIITREDVQAHFDLVLDYAIEHRSVNILYPGGAIVALLSRHRVGAGGP